MDFLPDIRTEVFPFHSIRMPFDAIEMRGSESSDLLQRISSNDLSSLQKGSIFQTLFVSDKGRIIDTVWVLHRNDHLLLLLSEGSSPGTLEWLNRYIIMEEITLTDVSHTISVTLHSDPEAAPYRTNYFGFPVSFEITGAMTQPDAQSQDFERWRISQGIPQYGKEIVQEYNPLELNLWNWISFTKGCYIGQEVIARLDTYHKIQRSLCRISSSGPIETSVILCDETGNDCGRVTSCIADGNSFLGLALLRNSAAVPGMAVTVKGTDVRVNVDTVFRKD